MFTLKRDISFNGFGIHSGKKVELIVEPSHKPGIELYYNDQVIKISVEAIGINHLRSTTLSNQNVTIQTPEHFLAACYSLELTNIKVTLTHYEFPILDGSALLYIEKLKDNRIPLNKGSRGKVSITEDITFKLNDSSYYAFPNSGLSITAVLSYPNDWIKTMTYSYTHSVLSFIKEIAPARTYGFEREIDQLKAQGLAKGGSLDNALVISGDGYVNQPRFKNELVRHKILDFIGDIAILGKQIEGHFLIVKPSHHGNCEFIKSL